MRHFVPAVGLHHKDGSPSIWAMHGNGNAVTMRAGKAFSKPLQSFYLTPKLMQPNNGSPEHLVVSYDRLGTPEGFSLDLCELLI